MEMEVSIPKNGINLQRTYMTMKKRIGKKNSYELSHRIFEFICDILRFNWISDVKECSICYC